ncbi:hypothetical protein FRC07_006687 [Ceratobasidium sp. 392]|nr:hypothetical protein FRC07_006687 [Ceratobasidium sp. 392]
MPASHFRADQVDYLLKFIPEWKSLKHDSTSKKAVPGELSARNRLVRRVIEGFYERFPERDSAQTDENQFTYTQDERDGFTPRLKQWFINKTRESGGHEAQALPKEKNNITPRMLISKHYSSDINAIAKDLRADKPSLNPMKAYNEATTIFIDKMTREEYQKFDKLAEKVRNGASLDYADQDKEVLKQMLNMFPQKMHTSVKTWTRSMPVHMYCMAVFTLPPENALRSYLLILSALSASMLGLDGSEEGEQIRSIILGWLEHTYGSQPIGRPDNVDPTVYPDALGNLHPMLPIVAQPSNLSRDTLRAWLRVYFKYLWQWQGGKGPVPWGKISKDDAHMYIKAKRFPEGVRVLKDPHDTPKEVLLQWYKHIVAGQNSEIDESKIFQFATVNPGPGLAPKQYTSLLRTQDSGSELRYAPDKKLYALKMAKGHDEPAASPSWRRLPLARTLDIYAPFDDATCKMMEKISTSDNKLAVLLTLLGELEKHGPTVDPGQQEPSSPLLPPSLTDVDVLAFLNTSLLPASFFDCLCRSPQNQFRHTASDTWRGGPHGARWIVIMIARVVITTLVARSPDSAPVELLRAVEAASLLRMEQQLYVFCNWVVDSFHRSIEILKVSHEPRSQLWKKTVASRHLKNQMLSGDPLIPDPGPSTHGVPQRRDEIASMYFRLSTSDPDVTLGTDNDLANPPPSPPSPPFGSLTISSPNQIPETDPDSDQDPTAPILPADLSRPREPHDVEELLSIVASVQAAATSEPTAGLRRTWRRHVRLEAAQAAIDAAWPKKKSGN